MDKKRWENGISVRHGGDDGQKEVGRQYFCPSNKAASLKGSRLNFVIVICF